jgi:Clp amino terminal domain, pathogenicity island component/ClpX C4-type zinc finger
MTLDETLLEQAKQARERLLDLQHDSDLAKADYHHTIRRLHFAGGSMREIAEALDLSHQRVHQIVDTTGDAPPPAGTERERGRERERRERRAGRAERMERDRQERRGERHERRERRGERRGERREGRFSPAAKLSGFFTDARQAMTYAEEEARLMQHDFIGTEHLLLGLLRVEPGLAARLLKSKDVDLDQSRAEVVQIVECGAEPVPDGPIASTARAKKVLDLAVREAKRDHASHVRTEHLLLALLREGQGVGAQVLAKQGVSRYDDVYKWLGQARLQCSFCERTGLDVDRLIAGPTVYICDECVAIADDAEHIEGTCSFCGRNSDQLYASSDSAPADATICDSCVDLCEEILAEEARP